MISMKWKETSFRTFSLVLAFNVKGAYNVATDSGEMLYAYFNLDRSLSWYF
jgi:hypothetical protein